MVQGRAEPSLAPWLGQLSKTFNMVLASSEALSKGQL